MNEFQRVLTKLTFLGLGVIFVSHGQEKEIETRTGKILKQVPSLSDKPRRFLTGLCDLVLFADFEPATAPDGTRSFRRVLRTKPSQHYEAGDRTGRLPEVIDFDFPAFVEAFRAATGKEGGAPGPSPTDGRRSRHIRGARGLRPGCLGGEGRGRLPACRPDRAADGPFRPPRPHRPPSPPVPPPPARGSTNRNPRPGEPT